MRKSLLAVSVAVCPQPARVAEAPAAPQAAPTQTHVFDRTPHSTTDPSSIWVIVNKSRPIAPSDFRPDPGLRLQRVLREHGRWLARTAWRFGFVVRYQPATTAVTGYAPEPWHLRYVGRPLATELHHTGIASLEEFFGVPGGDYPR